jgi:hypothetical protein
VVKVDPDAESPEIVVTAQKIKTALTGIAGGAAIQYPVDIFNTPCSGPYSFNDVLGNAKNLTFRLVTQSFGPGRAGQNLVGSDGSSVPVLVNAQSAIDYSNLPNGALYLVGHELAHALKPMQDYNNQLWQQYVSQSDPNLTQQHLVDAYPNSPEFAANEARANSIAKVLVELAGLGSIGFAPTHGFEC